MRKDGTPVKCFNCNGNHYRNECPELVNTKEEGKALDKTGYKLNTIGIGVQWDDFDINDWQFFTRGVVEGQSPENDHLDWIESKKREVDDEINYYFLNTSLKVDTVAKNLSQV